MTILSNLNLPLPFRQINDAGLWPLFARSAIPFVGLSTGSISAPGAISGITALPFAYASAYCYFPANALATSIAAGWYYCTFTTTTAGTAYLNTYTSGTPTIPTSLTAVTDGKGSFTGHTSEETGPSITVPAGAMGASGMLRVTTLWSCNNSAGTKVSKCKIGSTDFMGGVSLTTSLSMQHQLMIFNRGAQNAQVTYTAATTSSYAASANANVQGAIDTSAAQTLALTMTRNTATDNAVLESYLIELYADGT